MGELSSKAIESLERLAALRSNGALTDEEFAAEKQKLLANAGDTRTPKNVTPLTEKVPRLPVYAAVVAGVAVVVILIIALYSTRQSVVTRAVPVSESALDKVASPDVGSGITSLDNLSSPLVKDTPAQNTPSVDRTAEIDTSFGPYVTAAVCEGEWWQKGERNGRSTLAWMENNGTPDLASDDYYVEYDIFYDGETLYLSNGIISSYRLENPVDGKVVPNKSFPMKRGGNGWVLNGEPLDACRN